MPFNGHRNKLFLQSSGSNYKTQQVTVATQATRLPPFLGTSQHWILNGKLYLPSPPAIQGGGMREQETQCVSNLSKSSCMSVV